MGAASKPLSSWSERSRSFSWTTLLRLTEAASSAGGWSCEGFGPSLEEGAEPAARSGWSLLTAAVEVEGCSPVEVARGLWPRALGWGWSPSEVTEAGAVGIPKSEVRGAEVVWDRPEVVPVEAAEVIEAVRAWPEVLPVAGVRGAEVVGDQPEVVPGEAAEVEADEVKVVRARPEVVPEVTVAGPGVVPIEVEVIGEGRPSAVVKVAEATRTSEVEAGPDGAWPVETGTRSQGA